MRHLEDRAVNRLAIDGKIERKVKPLPVAGLL